MTFDALAYRLAIDTGGTFTDFVLVDESGAITEAKTPTTKEEPQIAIEKGLRELARSEATSTEELLSNCDLIIHGTTVAVNALLQQRGARTGLLCTDGFRDSLEIRLGWKEERFDYRAIPPPVLVPRYLRRPIRERVDRAGRVITALHEEDVEEAAKVFRREGVEAVAICFLWSFLHPAHEHRASKLMQDLLPDAYVSASVDVAPQIREYDRTSTTVVNAYVGPILIGHLERVETFLREMSYVGEIRYLQSNGGLAAPHAIKKRAVLALNSGPAAGPAAGVFYGQLLGHQDLITVDMGGTSFDACLIRRGEASTMATADFEGYRVAAPMTSIRTIGAGGGSIAWLEENVLKVGPESAEAIPGPACYMKGGTAPTVTDADLVLGYLNPAALLDGAFPIDRDSARMVMGTSIGGPAGLSPDEASVGVYELVNRNMADAILELSSALGCDPRDFALMAAGGQGGVHAAALAEELDISLVLIPKNASTFCALGAVVADVRHDYRRSLPTRLREADPLVIGSAFEEMEREAFEELIGEGVAPDSQTSQRIVEIRYINQIYECSVDVSDLSLDVCAVEEIERRFHEVHEALYTYSNRREETELVNISLVARGRMPQPMPPYYPSGGPSASGARVGERMMRFASEGAYEMGVVYDGTKLLAGNLVVGPAVIEEPHTTIVVPPRFCARLSQFGVYLMTRVDGTNQEREVSESAASEPTS